jgi:methionyl aminopeptidase
MVHLKSNREINLMRESADLVSRTLAELGRRVEPGVSLLDLDAAAEEFIRSEGGDPAFKGHEAGDGNTYPATLCTSVNDGVVHCIPTEYKLREGDLLSIDVGVFLNGYVGDMAYTFAVGELADEDAALCRVTYESLHKGMEQAVAGNYTGDVGHAVETHCRGYGVVEGLCGHGVGRELWEDPQVPNVGEPGGGRRLKRGLTICVEPMINRGGAAVHTDDDGWSVRTADGSNSAHYEHMLVVEEGEPLVLSTFDYVEDTIDVPYEQPIPA